MRLTLRVDPRFNFWLTVYSHGWASLAPFEILKDRFALRRVVECAPGRAAVVEITQPKRGVLAAEVRSGPRRGANDRRVILSQLRTCLRLDDDLGDFYSEANKRKEFRWAVRRGAGRLLRSPSVFEDVVKMICTTNCSWALTEIMVRNLCAKLGVSADGSLTTFPGPESIAGCSEKFLRREIRAGYRAPYLRELSKRVVSRELDPESWRGSDLPTDELYRQVSSVKGVGPYAAGNILKLLGRYDFLAIDSWCRKRFFELHKNGRRSTDKAIERFYEPFGKWRGLFFWLDLTKHWYDHEFPF